MRKSGSHRIITKAKTQAPHFVIFFILGIGALLRLSRIDALTEFLGDQGRTSIIMDTWLSGGSLPLVGPTTLTGQHLGPIFYYILSPAFLVGGNSPFLGSIWMALLGIVGIWVLYKATLRAYGLVSALIVSALYTVSPHVVKADRIIWEPNLVPLFGFLYALLVMFVDRNRHISAILIGIVSGVLVQLHYPNLLFIGLSGLLFMGQYARDRSWNAFWARIGFFVLGFGLVCGPFLWYQVQNQFIDIRQILEIMMTSSGGIGKRMMLHNMMDYSSRVVGTFVPGVSQYGVIIILGVWFLYLVTHLSRMGLFWMSWFGLGIVLMARYSGVVYDHYLLFLLPPFILGFASVLESFWNHRMFRSLLVLSVVIFCFFQVQKGDYWAKGNHDISRIKSASGAVLQHERGEPFAFTLVNSRSFSDLHYRYFFYKKSASLSPITQGGFGRLYIICDSADCPDPEEIASRPLNTICYDPHCKGIYPTLDLSRNFLFEKLLTYTWGTSDRGLIYVFLPK